MAKITFSFFYPCIVQNYSHFSSHEVVTPFNCLLVDFYLYFYGYISFTTPGYYNAADCWLWCDCGAHGLSSRSQRELAGQEVVLGWLVGASVVMT